MNYTHMYVYTVIFLSIYVHMSLYRNKNKNNERVVRAHFRVAKFFDRLKLVSQH